MTFFKSLSFPKCICYYPKNILVVESVLHEIIMAEFNKKSSQWDKTDLVSK